MHILSDEQVSSVEGLIAKLDSSLIKARIEKWLAEVEPTRRITSEQLEQFRAFALHLPKEVQYFPSSFVQAVKNAPTTLKREESEGIEETADLDYLVDESIAHVPDSSDTEENVEEPLHKLGTTTKSGKKKIAVKGKKK